MEQQRTVLLYPADRAIEMASNVPDLIPMRLFALLYPLWLVEIGAYEETKRPYALIEHFIERGIYEAQLHTVEEMVNFFGLSSALVKKVLNFLSTIQHVQQINGRWTLTERGIQSLMQGSKSVKKDKGQYLYFDAFCSKPLLREHYKHLRVVSNVEAESVTRTPTGGYQFYRLHTSAIWNITALNDLVQNPERERYNLPGETRVVTATGWSLVYMPMYIIETKKHRQTQPHYLVYTHIKNQRDEFFEQLVNKTPDIQRRLESTPGVQEEELIEIWSKWLRSKGLAYLYPERTSEGLWRVVLPETLFQSTEYPLRKIGTYYKAKGYFLQFWCNNDALRRQAVFDRALYMITERYKTLSRNYLEELLRRWSSLLGVAPVSFQELRRWAQKQNAKEEVMQKIAGWCEEKSS